LVDDGDVKGLAVAVEYSTRLGHITPAQFQAALDRFGLGTFVRAEPVVGGLFGQNVFVTSTGGELVLRGVPHYDWQLPTERFFARLLHERTQAPVPWPYLLDPAEDIFGWSYALMPRMPGLQLGDPSVIAGLSLPDRLAIARALGENLVLMHQLDWPVAGRYDFALDAVAPLRDGFAEWVAGDVRDRLARAWSHSARTTEADVAWVEELLQGALPALRQPFRPCYVMHDYKEQNTVVTRGGTGWRVTGVFDLMEGFFGDREMDLARPVGGHLEEDPLLAQAFLAAYFDRVPARPGFGERFAAYMLRDRLIIWEYVQRHGVTGAMPHPMRLRPPWDPDLTLRAWAEPYIAEAGALIAPHQSGASSSEP
jgi:hygromycin-B 7''-O-kinase